MSCNRYAGKQQRYNNKINMNNGYKLALLQEKKERKNNKHRSIFRHNNIMIVKYEAAQKKIKKENKPIWVDWILPSEITHLICSFLGKMIDMIHLSLCNKFLYIQIIKSDDLWLTNYTKRFDEKPNTNFKGKWREMYIAKYKEMMTASDRLLWVISDEKPRQILEVITSKNFISTMTRDPIDYLKLILPKSKNIEMLTILFDYNWDVQEHKDQLLVSASEGHVVSEGYADICTFLLKNKANPNVKNVSSVGVLLTAALNGKLNICKALVEHGANIEQTYNPNGATALYCAAQNGHHQIITYLGSKGADPNSKYFTYTPLYMSIQKNYKECVGELLSAGADPNLISASTSPLHYACSLGFSDIVTILLEYNADPAIIINGKTPLFIAAEKGYDKIVESLLSYNYDEEANDYDNAINIMIEKVCHNKTALYAACENNHVNVVRILLKYNANVNFKYDANESTPLHIACVKNNPDIVQLLCEKMAEIKKGCIDDAKDACKRLLNFYTKVREAQTIKIGS